MSIKYDSTELENATYLPRYVHHETAPERLINSLKLARQDGEVIIDDTLSIKYIEISGILVGSSRSDLDGKIDAFKELISRKDKNLDVTWVSGIRRYVCRSITHEFNRDFYNILHVPYTIKFFVATGYGTDTSETTALNKTGIVAATDSEEVTLAGSYNPKPKHTINLDTRGNADIIRLENEDTGDYMDIDLGEDSADEDDESVSKTATFYINTDKDLESGTHQAQLEIEYKTGSEKRFQTLSFDLPVKGKPLFNIISTSTSPKVTMQGQPGQLSIQIQNIGEEKGQETSIRVFENSDLPIEFDQKTNFIGDLEKGEIGTAIFKFEVEEDAPVKEYLIKIQTRTLNNNNVIVEEYTIPLVIKAEEGTGAGAIIIMIPTILIILVGIFGIYRVKKRKNTINPNSKKTKTSEYY